MFTVKLFSVLVFVSLTAATADNVSDILEKLSKETEGKTGLSTTELKNSIVQCDSTYKCQNGGKCIQNHCECLQGTEGDLCEIVTECKTEYCDDTSDCGYDILKQEATCICRDPKHVLDESGIGDLCKECECGLKTVNCSFNGRRGNKLCTCMKGYADKNGTCTECSAECGEHSTGCLFDKEVQTCECEDGFADKSGVCTRCSCGDHTDTCDFEDGEKHCTCDKGYQFKLGTCVDCKEECGEHSKGCLLGKKGLKHCYCEDGYAVKSGICTQCNCGSHTKTCNFYQEKESCICEDGYKLKLGVCTECSCGEHSSYCYFNEEARTCTCDSGYADKFGTCTNCTLECGEPSTGCSFYDGNKRCECKQGYGDQAGTCTQCNCGEHATAKGCFYGITGKEEKMCLCEDGYYQSAGICQVLWFQTSAALGCFIAIPCLLVFGTVLFVVYRNFRSNKAQSAQPMGLRTVS